MPKFKGRPASGCRRREGSARGRPGAAPAAAPLVAFVALIALVAKIAQRPPCGNTQHTSNRRRRLLLCLALPVIQRCMHGYSSRETSDTVVGGDADVVHASSVEFQMNLLWEGVAESRNSACYA